MEDHSLLTFRALSNFVQDLNEVFGEKYRPLKLYQHLLGKTTLNHEEAIMKHIRGISDFCIQNREGLVNKDINKLYKDKISFSDRVFIPVIQILKSADKETKQIIWKHLLKLSAFVDPTSNAKQILKDSLGKSHGKEEHFLHNIIEQVEEHVSQDEQNNPMEVVSNILSSGMFTDLISSMNNGIQDGNLDMGKMMGVVQQMMSQLSQDDDSLDITNMMGNLTKMLGNPESTSATLEEID